MKVHCQKLLQSLPLFPSEYSFEIRCLCIKELFYCRKCCNNLLHGLLSYSRDPLEKEDLLFLEGLPFLLMPCREAYQSRECSARSFMDEENDLCSVLGVGGEEYSNILIEEIEDDPIGGNGIRRHCAKDVHKIWGFNDKICLRITLLKSLQLFKEPSCLDGLQEISIGLPLDSHRWEYIITRRNVSYVNVCLFLKKFNDACWLMNIDVDHSLLLSLRFIFISARCPVKFPKKFRRCRKLRQ